MAIRAGNEEPDQNATETEIEAQEPPAPRRRAEEARSPEARRADQGKACRKAGSEAQRQARREAGHQIEPGAKRGRFPEARATAGCIACAFRSADLVGDDAGEMVRI